MADAIINEDRLRFEIPVGPEFAYLDYRWHHNDLVLMHTFVPEAARGQHMADRLAAFALQYAATNKLKVIVYCPFVSAYLKRHPEMAINVADRNS